MRDLKSDQAGTLVSLYSSILRNLFIPWSQPTNNASGVVYATPTNAVYNATHNAILTASIVVASVVWVFVHLVVYTFICNARLATSVGWRCSVYHYFAMMAYLLQRRSHASF